MSAVNSMPVSPDATTSALAGPLPSSNASAAASSLPQATVPAATAPDGDVTETTSAQTGKSTTYQQQFSDLVDAIQSELLQQNADALAAQAAVEQAQEAAAQAALASADGSPPADGTTAPTSPDSSTPNGQTTDPANSSAQSSSGSQPPDSDNPTVQVLSEEQALQQAREMALGYVRTNVEYAHAERSVASEYYVQQYSEQSAQRASEMSALETMMSEAMQPFTELQRSIAWNHGDDEAQIDQERRSLNDDLYGARNDFDVFTASKPGWTPPIESSMTAAEHQDDESELLRDQRRVDGAL